VNTARAASLDFRVEATLGVASTSLLLLTPFAVNNVLQGRHLVGAGSLAIVAALVATAWGCLRGRYRPNLTLASLVPAILFFLLLALRTQGVIGALWSYPALLSFYFVLPERHAWAANGALLCVVLPQAWSVLDAPVALRASATLVAVSVFSAIFVRVIGDQQRRLLAQAATDPLTGLSNRSLFDATIEHAVAHSQRSGKPLTLVAIDVDYFKAINDSLGHAAGDSVLQGLGELLRKRLRSSDRAFRLGGEEFLAVLYGADAQSGLRIAEELRRSLWSTSLLENRPVSASLGVATLQPGEGGMECLKRADANLYRAKQTGRNRVVA
jgi:diguanylate cyclase (GGDEF)-like protein